MAEADPDRQTLQQREARLDELEVSLAFDDAQLRGREQMIASQRQAMTQRAAWLDDRENRLLEGARRRDPAQLRGLSGLGGGRALQDADVEGFVAKSSTLHLGRVALLAAREEMLVRRQQLLEQRRRELIEYEAAFSRAEVRLSARERLVGEATSQLLQQMAGGAVTSPVPAQTDPRPSPSPDRPSSRSAIAQAGPGLSLQGHPLTRDQVEFDRPGGTILVSFDGFAPALPEFAELLLLPDPTRSLPVRVKRIMAMPPGGSIAVLAPLDWNSKDLLDFEELLSALQ